MNYANVEGNARAWLSIDASYERCYLSMGEILMLKTPARVTSQLNGWAYVAAGQAGGALHIMAMLQAYQADLLKVLDDGQGLFPEAVTELCQTTDLALWAPKQTAATVGLSTVAIVTTERRLWVNLADIGEKEKHFLLEAPVSPSVLFGTSFEAVVESFRECRVQSAAFNRFILCRPRSAP